MCKQGNASAGTMHDILQRLEHRHRDFQQPVRTRESLPTPGMCQGPLTIETPLHTLSCVARGAVAWTSEGHRAV